jgi:hypothetical protein
LIQLYVEKGDIDRATYMHHKMSNVFNEKVMSEYQEYTNILENARRKQAESFKTFSGYAKNPNKKEEKKDDSISLQISSSSIGKPARGKWFSFIFGGILTLFGAGTLYFLFRNKNRYNI